MFPAQFLMLCLSLWCWGSQDFAVALSILPSFEMLRCSFELHPVAMRLISLPEVRSIFLWQTWRTTVVLQRSYFFHPLLKKKKKGFMQCWGCFEWGWVCTWVCASAFLQASFKGWGKMWTLDKFGDFEGLILSDTVIAVWQWPDGCLLSFLSKGGQTFHLDVILKLSCSCVKPHRISEITISIEWADFWRFGHDKDHTLFLTFWGHCSMEVL